MNSKERFFKKKVDTAIVTLQETLTVLDMIKADNCTDDDMKTVREALDCLFEAQERLKSIDLSKYDGSRNGEDIVIYHRRRIKEAVASADYK